MGRRAAKLGRVQTDTAPIAAALEPERLARTIVAELSERQAEAIVLLEVFELTDLADCFVIASATSRRHFGALEDTLRKIPDAPHARREGTADGGWQLFDFGSVWCMCLIARPASTTTSMVCGRAVGRCCASSSSLISAYS